MSEVKRTGINSWEVKVCAKVSNVAQLRWHLAQLDGMKRLTGQANFVIVADGH